MHVQIVNFQLSGLDEAHYRFGCEDEAPAFAAVPGLLSKVWLAHSTSTYGGVYMWWDRQALQTLDGSDLFRGIAADLAPGRSAGAMQTLGG